MKDGQDAHLENQSQAEQFRMLQAKLLQASTTVLCQLLDIWKALLIGQSALNIFVFDIFHLY
ncbi:hypothetical protein ACSF7A_06820 [Escherichia coli]|uniref:hypothetical protein n=1 Tax=Escherichia coli TaxID=562 RepID=UPI003EEC01F9